MTKVAALVLVLALGSAPEEALGPVLQGRWTQIGMTATKNPVFVDLKSVKTTGGIVTAALRVTYVEPLKVGKEGVNATWSTAMFDCAKRLIAVKQTTMFYNEKAGRVYEKRVVKIPGYGTTFKGSFSDVAMQYFCKK